MVTIMVGKKNGSAALADIVTYCDGADEPHRITFDLTELKPGLPK